jgi:non-specific serine/threonine protein kinase
MIDVTPQDFATFGGLLRFLRQRAGLTLRALSEKVNYTDSLLSRLEKDERQPNLKWVEETLLPALEIDDPALEKLLVSRAIAARRDEQPPDGDATLHSATPLSSFVGRRAEMEGLIDALSRHRLITLCGPGGCGKTRLAVETAQLLRQQRGLEVWFIDLSACQDMSAVLHTIASTLHITLLPADPIASIARFFGTRAALLVIDNAEHIIGASAKVSDRILHLCPSLVVLVTSREPLRLSGEHVRRVSPLSLPGSDDIDALNVDQLQHYEAIELFIARACDVAGDAVLRWNAESLRDVARMCWRLDGLPLAIELAAARASSMAISDILAHMDDRFALLTTGSRIAPERQVSLEQAIDWSYVLLDAQEQRVFRRLAVFAGGWTMHMAAQICADDMDDTRAVIKTITSLVEKSMVVFGIDVSGNTRYSMLESIRAYALMKLDEAGEREDMCRRHAHCMVRMVESVELKLFGPEQVEVLRAHKNNLDNIRAAFTWLMDDADYGSALQMAGALRRFWQTRSHVGEGRMWLSHMLSHKEMAPIDMRARAVFTAAVLADYQNDVQASIVLTDEAVALARQCDDKWLSSQILVGLVYKDRSHAAVLEWRQRVAGVYEIAVAIGNHWLIGDVYHKLAGIEVVDGNYDAALCCLQQSELELLQAGDAIYATVNRVWLGTLLFDRGDYARAKAHYLTALAAMQRAGLDLSEYIAISYCLQGLADVAAMEQQQERMAQLLGAVELEREWLGGMANHWFPPLDVNAGAARYAEMAGAPADPQTYRYFWQKGRQRTLAQSVVFALALPKTEN